jgi:hypothetical protein
MEESHPSISAPQESPIEAELRRDIQQVEQARVAMLFFFFALLAVLALVRRLLGCEAMQGNALLARLVLLGVGVFYCARSIHVANRANAEDKALGDGYWVGTATIELLLILGMMVAAELLTQRDAIEDLGAPVLLMVPLLIVLSIVRLRPTQTLVTGLVAATVHAGLSVGAFVKLQAPLSGLPTVLTYSVLMAMSGLAGSFVSAELLKIVRGAKRQRQRAGAAPGK